MSVGKMVFSLSSFLVLLVTVSIFAEPSSADEPFVNCSGETGLDGKWGADSAALMRNMATIDFNGDGILDLIISKRFHSTPSLNRGDAFEGAGPTLEGTPTFIQSSVFSELAKPKNGTSGYLFADFDNDGDTDFYAPNPAGHQLYEYNSATEKYEDNTTFRGLSSTMGSVNATWGDYDGDGRVDLLIMCGSDDDSINHSSSTQILYQNQLVENETVFALADTSNFTSATTVSSAQMVDMDGDYDLDILLLQNTRSSLPYTSTYQVNDGLGHFSLKSNGFGSVAKEIMCQHDNYATVTDINNDGRFDLIFGNSWDVGYCLSDEQGNFSDDGCWTDHLTSTDNPNAWDLTALDYNLDGFNDFLVSYRDGGYMPRLYTNRNLHGDNESFTPTMQFLDVGGQRGMCVGDFANDHTTGDFSMAGFPEICFANDQPAGQDTTHYFYQRQPLGPTIPKNNWVGFELSSPGGTVDGRCIGATVTVSADSLGLQSQFVDGGSGRASQRALDLVFGLGGGTTPVDAEIKLPIGKSVYLNQIPINDYTKIAVDGVIDDTVLATKLYDVASETMTLSFTWNTIGVENFDPDIVVFYTDESDACTPGGSVFIGTDAPKEVSSTEKIWSHQVVIEGIPCTPNCAYYYSVQSQNGSLYMASSQHSLRITSCPKAIPSF